MIENLDKMDLEIIWISPDHDKTTAIGRIIISMGKLVKRQGRKTMGLRVKFFADDRQVAFFARIQPAFFSYLG